MPNIDIERAHSDMKIRLRGPHQISYVVVGRRENVGLPIPQLLRNRCIHTTAGLPKSGLQVMDPQWYQRYHLDRNLPQPVRFGVIFDENFPTSSIQFDDSALFYVVYWATRDAAALRSLVQIKSRLGIVPMIDGLKADLLNAGVDQDAILENSDAIYDRIEQEVSFHLHTGPVSNFEERIATNQKIAEEWRQQILPGAQRPFNPLDVNRNQLRQLLGQFRSNFWHYEKEKQLEERARAQVESFHSVVTTLFAIAKNNGDTRLLRPPSAIVAFPSISPFLKKQLENRIKEADKDFRPALKELVALRLEEQDSSSFEIKISAKDKQVAARALPVILPELASYTRFFDDVGYLHASFHTSPYLRAALKGKSLAQHHSFFAPGTFPATAKPSAILRRITTFSASLTGALDPLIHRTITDYPGGIVGLSDLPLEWLTDRNVPLCFSHDVCRIPETVSTNILSHFNHNSHFSFEIDSNLLAKTLVICGAPADDLIAKSFESLTSLWRENGSPWALGAL